MSWKLNTHVHDNQDETHNDSGVELIGTISLRMGFMQ